MIHLRKLKFLQIQNILTTFKTILLIHNNEMLSLTLRIAHKLLVLQEEEKPPLLSEKLNTLLKSGTTTQQVSFSLLIHVKLPKN